MFELFMQGLALSRLLRLFIVDDGPWKILEKFRLAIGINKIGIPDENKMLANLFSCYWCLGIWISPIVFITYKFVPSIIYVLAIAELGCLVYALAERVMYE